MTSEAMDRTAVETRKASTAGEPHGGGGALTLERLPNGVALITYDVTGESVNTLRGDFISAFLWVLTKVEVSDDIRAAVLVSGKPDNFIVGADIDMLSRIRSTDDAMALAQRGQDALVHLAACKRPVVAAIHGQALGGGFEVALACHARVLSSSDKTALGFPEVKIGLIPALDGLQRLAALAGLQIALDYGLTGKNMYAAKARSLGIADDVVPLPILRSVAIELAITLADGDPSTRRGRAPKRALNVGSLTTVALEKNPVGRSVLFKKAREQVEKTTGGHYPAPFRAIDVLETLAKSGFEASQREEAAAFAALVTGDVSAHLRSIFFATTALKKDSGVDDPSLTPRRVDKIAVLGAGLMGAGIAGVSIEQGIGVRLKDRDAAALGLGLKHIAGVLGDKRAKRQITPSQERATLARLSTAVDYSGMRNVELVIEAVFEDLELKRRVLAEVEAACKPGVIFASNTSSIPIASIAQASRAPENVVGMHYFSPVHKMPLLEVIRTQRTAAEVVATVVAVGKRQGKTVIVVNDGTGFYTSRIIGPYMNEACHMLTEGVPIDAIDAALRAWGWPVGPITLLDEVGIDVAAHVGPIMLAAFGDRVQPPPIAHRLVEEGRKGKKSARGFYLYGAAAAKKGKGKHVDETVYATLGLPVPDRRRAVVSVEEMQERCSLQLVNEALFCLGDGILRSPRDGDIGAIFGLGFPPFRGGPFRWVDEVGARRVLAKVEAFRDRFGARWTPAPALIELAKTGRRLY